MTWNELAEAIMALPDEVRELDANIWLPDDWENPWHGVEFIDVIGLSAFDGDLPYSIDNFASINIDER